MKLIVGICLGLFVSMTIFSQTDNTGIKPNKPKPSSPKNIGTKGKDKSRNNGSSAPKSAGNSYTPKSKPAPSLELVVNQIASQISVHKINNGIEENIATYYVSEPSQKFPLRDLKTGEYIIRVRKKGFFPQEKNIVLKQGDKKSLPIDLKPSDGFLTVVSNIQDAEIEIRGIGNFVGKLNDLMMSPGAYEVFITKDGYESQTQLADVRLGQTTLISATLKPISIEKILQDAESAYKSENYDETLKNCRLVLEKKPEEPRVNLLMGYTYFYKARSQAAHFYLRKALALQANVEIPVKYYQKEKNSETLTSGRLKINSSNISFSADNNSAPSFSLNPSSIQKIEIKREKQTPAKDSVKPDWIEIQAAINNGRKTEKKKMRLYPRQAFAKVVSQNRAEVASCSGCQNGICPCQSEITAVYELLSSWKTSAYPNQFKNEPETPEKSATFYNNQLISLNIPNNWQLVSQNENSFWFAPRNGFYKAQNITYFRYGINTGVRPAQFNDLNLESEKLYETLFQTNNYLDQQQQSKEILINGRKGRVTVFAGFGIQEQEEEMVTIYTSFTSQGNLFYLISVTPFHKRAIYQPVFRDVLTSVKF